MEISRENRLAVGFLGNMLTLSTIYFARLEAPEIAVSKTSKNQFVNRAID
jgi:hypothetical protein